MDSQICQPKNAGHIFHYPYVSYMVKTHTKKFTAPIFVVFPLLAEGLSLSLNGNQLTPFDVVLPLITQLASALADILRHTLVTGTMVSLSTSTLTLTRPTDQCVKD